MLNTAPPTYGFELCGAWNMQDIPVPAKRWERQGELRSLALYRPFLSHIGPNGPSRNFHVHPKGYIMTAWPLGAIGVGDDAGGR